MENFQSFTIRKKYCPAMRQNIIFKVFENGIEREECINKEVCEKNGGCKNSYINKKGTFPTSTGDGFHSFF